MRSAKTTPAKTRPHEKEDLNSPVKSSTARRKLAIFRIAQERISRCVALERSDDFTDCGAVEAGRPRSRPLSRVQNRLGNQRAGGKNCERSVCISVHLAFAKSARACTNCKDKITEGCFVE
jgi:hypothetical protein